MGPSVPDLRGLFLRGYGSQAHAQVNGTTVGVTSTLHASGQLGQVQGDASRNIQGTTSVKAEYNSQWDNGNGALYNYHWNGQGFAQSGTSGGHGSDLISFDASRIVPTAPENRPVNVAVRYLVRARP